MPKKISINSANAHITNLPDPIDDQDAANKRYVDSGVAGAGGGFSAFQVFTVNGNFTVPAGKTKIMVEAVGGGGGGGGAGNVGGYSGGGGGGAYGKQIFTVTPAQILAVVVGQGGGVNSPNDGSPGTASTVTGTGVAFSAGGGNGGRGGDGGNVGEGGTSTATFNLDGEMGLVVSADAAPRGDSGGSFWGSGEHENANGDITLGGIGAGGAGGALSNPDAVGHAGRVVIWY